MTMMSDPLRQAAPDGLSWNVYGCRLFVRDGRGNDDTVGNIVDPGNATRVAAAVNVCHGLNLSDLTAKRYTIVKDITVDYDRPLFMMHGNRDEMVEHAITILEGNGYTVTPPQEA